MRIEDGVLLNAAWHEKRFTRTIREYYERPVPDGARRIGALLESFPLPPELMRGRVKCRLLYDFDGEEFDFRAEYAAYQKRKVGSLRLVDGSPGYRYKFTDREGINRLMEARGSCDDIIIVRDGLLTDASSANIALLRGGRWYTPAEPLLRGTMRGRLLDEGFLTPADIGPADLKLYEGLKLINAMLPFDEQPLIPVSAVEGI